MLTLDELESSDGKSEKGNRSCASHCDGHLGATEQGIDYFGLDEWDDEGYGYPFHQTQNYSFVSDKRVKLLIEEELKGE